MALFVAACRNTLAPKTKSPMSYVCFIGSEKEKVVQSALQYTKQLQGFEVLSGELTEIVELVQPVVEYNVIPLGKK